MTLDNITALRGSAQLIASYKHVGTHKFSIMFIFKDGSDRKFVSDQTYRTKTALMHDWNNNRHKFYGYNYNETN